MSDSSIDEKRSNPEKHNTIAVETRNVDTAAELLNGDEGELDPVEALRVRRKIDLHIMPLMCSLYWIQFMDKTTLGSAAILGIRESTHLTTNQYNWLGTIFYLSYLTFEIPQNLALQRFPVGKWLRSVARVLTQDHFLTKHFTSINIFVWAVALSCHSACKNFAGLLVCRLVLGMCEGSITAGFLIVTSMFYTRNEQTLRVGYWFLMNGFAQIISGFLSFGALHIKTRGFEPWQWLMIITGLITLIAALSFWFMFPDSPTTAWFLTKKERAIAVRRIKVNQTGVENKTFKKEQMFEALRDPKTWLIALFSASVMVPNSLTNQRQIIVSSFGFSNLQATLLGCVDGVVTITTIWSGVWLAARFPNSRAYVAILYTLPNIVAVFLINFLPWENKIGLLFAQWTSGLVTNYVLSLSWLSAITSGHTKKITVNAIALCAYCIGNSAGPFMWQSKYRPRNHLPWTVIGVCHVICIICLGTLRFHLARQNKLRDQEPVDHTYDDVYIERVVDGVLEKIKVDKEFLDLTDIQNRDFRYVL
ncbi:MFS general substrate transporter [Lyophyllum atratum]|nr:MFS general substrate transporter [Lyophyllum atratum]